MRFAPQKPSAKLALPGARRVSQRWKKTGQKTPCQTMRNAACRKKGAMQLSVGLLYV